MIRELKKDTKKRPKNEYLVILSVNLENGISLKILVLGLFYPTRKGINTAHKNEIVN